METNNKAVIYCRVGSMEQVDRKLAVQRKSCRAVARGNGYKVVAVFSEQVSGILFPRPALTELLTYCKDKKNGIKTVFVINHACLSRNAVHLQDILKSLAQHNIQVEYVQTLKEERGILIWNPPTQKQ